MNRLALISMLCFCQFSWAAETRVGSKLDNESVLLGEIASALIRNSGPEVTHRKQLGGTPVLWQAILAGEIDLYPEFTGTLAFQILKDPQVVDFDRLVQRLADLGLGITNPLGYENNYAIGVRQELAKSLQITKISDLRKHPDLRLRLSAEFVKRADGWQALKRYYNLPHADPDGIEHALAYQGLAAGSVDVTDVYTTEAEIDRYQVQVLQDDLSFFPRYAAIFVYRLDWSRDNPNALKQLRRLEGRLDEQQIRRMNQRTIDKIAESETAADYLATSLQTVVAVESESITTELLRHTREHLWLVLVSLSAAITVALPLGIASAYYHTLGQAILSVTGLIQTIPTLALLVILVTIPAAWGGGLGWKPAVIALFLYSLLPIVRNTATGLRDILPALRETADAIGLSPWQRLWYVELPMASRSILAGIKTAAVINVGTATLGALIDAGGLGVPIQQGLRINDTKLILYGAIPAAILALIVQGLFDLIERWIVPRGLRLRSHH